jgi:hypothetical protein
MELFRTSSPKDGGILDCVIEMLALTAVLMILQRLRTAKSVHKD